MSPQPDPSLEELGNDPDPRFRFANERTFLAWNRTSLALIAAGLAVAQLLKFGIPGARLVIALPLFGLGAYAAFTSYRRWEANERALRLGQPMPSSGMPRGSRSASASSQPHPRVITWVRVHLGVDKCHRWRNSHSLPRCGVAVISSARGVFLASSRPT